MRNPILACFSLISLFPALLCFCPRCSQWLLGLSSALTQWTLLSTERRETIINNINCMSWTKLACEEPRELADGELMVTSISWTSKWERQTLKPIYSAAWCSTELGHFGCPSVCFIRLLWPLYISPSHYPLWLWEMFKVNFKESLELLNAVEGTLASSFARFNPQGSPEWTADPLLWLKRVGLVGHCSDGKTNPGVDAALAAEGTFFWLILSRGCKVQVILGQPGQRLCQLQVDKT